MKTVLVTGASGGIGSAIAQTFAQNGYAVAIHYFEGRQNAERLAEELTASGHTAFLVQADVASKQQVTAMIDEITKQTGGVDVLVNNAGIANYALVTDVTEQEWQKLLGVNLSGAFYCAQAVLPYMVKQKQGAIINISSVWGVCGASCEVAYSATKAGLIGFTKALAKEVGPSGIRVNCIAPGVIETKMNANLSESTMQELKDATPLGRTGTPEEVAKLALFLAGTNAEFITGQTICVDGGFAL